MYVSRITKSFNYSVTFFPTCCVIQDLKTGKKIVAGLSAMAFTTLIRTSPTNVALQSSTFAFQDHCHLGQPSLNSLKKLILSSQSLSTLPCEACELSKHCHTSFYPQVESCMSRPLQLIHSDIWGPMHVKPYSGFQYFVIFVDDFSRITCLYLM